MEGRFAGKVVLITGAASGLGAEAAHQFAAEGARLLLVDIDGAGLTEQVGNLRRRGWAAVMVVGDVSKPETARSARAMAATEFGRIDILVNNAGIDPWEATNVVETSLDHWHAVIDVNLSSAYLFCREVLPAMVTARSGAVINTASIAGIKASSQEAVYGVSKAGLIHLTKVVARDFARHNIRCNCICPGFMEEVMKDRRQDMTEAMLADRHRRAEAIVPLGRQGRYGEVARSILFLASETDAGYITGASIVVDGGLSIA